MPKVEFQVLICSPPHALAHLCWRVCGECVPVHDNGIWGPRGNQLASDPSAMFTAIDWRQSQGTSGLQWGSIQPNPSLSPDAFIFSDLPPLSSLCASALIKIYLKYLFIYTTDQWIGIIWRVDFLYGMDIFATQKWESNILLMMVYIFPVLMCTGHGYCYSLSTSLTICL